MSLAVSTGVVPSDNALLPLDPTCPHCKCQCDIGEIHDGGEYTCEGCGAYLNAVGYGDSMGMVLVSGPPKPPLSGRARTRKRWERTGRR